MTLQKFSTTLTRGTFKENHLNIKMNKSHVQANPRRNNQSELEILYLKNKIEQYENILK